LVTPWESGAGSIAKPGIGENRLRLWLQAGMNSFAPAWFTRVGLPLSEQEQAGIAAMLRSLDLAPGAPIVGAASWREAAQVIRAEEWDSRWWDAEEEERERLWSVAAERLTENELLARLTAVTSAFGDPVRNGASFAASRGGVADSGLVRAAADAALLAAHQQALANLAGVPDEHYFQRKFELFATGRWPLGVFSGKYVVF
jgi:hypothetical protein